MGTTNDKQSLKMENNVVRIRLLGHVEIENEQGKVSETGREYASSFRLMKYLLLHCRKDISLAEAVETAFPGQSEKNWIPLV